jgi:hypothetical protein
MYQKPIIITKCQAIIVTINLVPQTSHFSATHFPATPPEDGFEHSDQSRTMAEQSPINCFNPKQTAATAKTQFSSLLNNAKNHCADNKIPYPNPT